MDAAFGLPGLVALYAIRIICDKLSKRYPSKSKLDLSCVPNVMCLTVSVSGRLFFFISVMRNAFVVIVLTIAAWLYCRDHVTSKGKYPIKILQTVPAGFQNVGPMHVDPTLVSALGSQIPVATIILLLEHIAIAKCRRLSLRHVALLTRARSIWPGKRIQNQSKPRTYRNWHHKHGRYSVPRLSRDGIVLPVCPEVQVRCADSSGWSCHRVGCHCCSIWSYPSLLLDPNRWPFSSHHSRRR